MSGSPDTPSDIAPEEQLARFILSSSYIRKQDSTVRPDAFIPHPHADLSVNRNDGLTDTQIWERGQDVASTRGRPLLGRADTLARVYLGQRLQVRPDPVENNAQHAIVVGWPPEKADQKMIALVVAANSKLFLR